MPEPPPVEIPIWVDLLAVFAAGIAASLMAIKRDFDVGGILIVTIVGALGGGIIRDTLIQRGTPAALTHSSYLIAAFAAAGAGFLFSRRAERLNEPLDFIDSIGLGLYTLVGVLKAFSAGLPIPGVIFIGVVSTSAGGITRDILLSKTPEVLLVGAPYTVLSLIGASVAVVLYEVGVSHDWLWWLPVIVVVVLRRVSLRYGWQTPRAIDLEEQVRRVRPRRVRVRWPRPLRSAGRRRRKSDGARDKKSDGA